MEGGDAPRPGPTSCVGRLGLHVEIGGITTHANTRLHGCDAGSTSCVLTDGRSGTRPHWPQWHRPWADPTALREVDAHCPGCAVAATTNSDAEMAAARATVLAVSEGPPRLKSYSNSSTRDRVFAGFFGVSPRDERIDSRAAAAKLGIVPFGLVAGHGPGPQRLSLMNRSARVPCARSYWPWPPSGPASS
jgi:hypothetical protein